MVVETVEVPVENEFEQERPHDISKESLSGAEFGGTPNESSDIKERYCYVLQIMIRSKNVNHLAAELRFTQEQMEMMEELL